MSDNKCNAYLYKKTEKRTNQRGEQYDSVSYFAEINGIPFQLSVEYPLRATLNALIPEKI